MGRKPALLLRTAGEEPAGMRKVNKRRKDALGGLSMKAKVYFTREITPESVVRLYRALGV